MRTKNCVLVKGSLDKKKNAKDLKRTREAIGKRMKEPDFEGICLEILKYKTNPWAIDGIMLSKQSVSEPWVRFWSMKHWFRFFCCHHVDRILSLYLDVTNSTTHSY